MKLLGMEYTIVSVAALGKCLRVVFECVWRSLRSGINYVEGPALLGQSELNMGSLTMNGTGLHVSGHSQAFAVNAVAHIVHLFDRHVVALALLHAARGKICEARYNNQYWHTKLQILIHSSPRIESASQSTATGLPLSPRSQKEYFPPAWRSSNAGIWIGCRDSAGDSGEVHYFASAPRIV